MKYRVYCINERGNSDACGTWERIAEEIFDSLAEKKATVKHCFVTSDKDGYRKLTVIAEGEKLF